MNNNLYSPLYDQIFEVWDEISEDKLKTELTSKINTYIPEITLEDLIFTFDEFNNVLTVKVVYGINAIGGTPDSVEIDVNVAQNPT